MFSIDTGTYVFRWRGVECTFSGFEADSWQGILDKDSWYESDLLDAILERYGTGGHYVDFGAFIGTHSLFFEMLCKADRVTAVEAHPAAYGLLYNNLINNNSTAVDPIQCAVGKAKGRARLDLQGNNWGCVSALPTNELEGTVPLVRSGDLITVPPKLIKIDCEDMSFDTLCGCLDVIEEYKPVVVMELPTQEHADQAEPVFDSLRYQPVGAYCHTPTFILEYAP